MKFIDEDQMKLIKNCPKPLIINTNLLLRIQRDDSSHHSRVIYLRLDNTKEEEFLFYGGGTDHTRLEYDGVYLTCRATGTPQCNSLAPDKPIKAVIVRVELNPRFGATIDGVWSRNRYDLEGSYYHIRCPHN